MYGCHFQKPLSVWILRPLQACQCHFFSNITILSLSHFSCLSIPKFKFCSGRITPFFLKDCICEDWKKDQNHQLEYPSTNYFLATSLPGKTPLVAHSDLLQTGFLSYRYKQGNRQTEVSQLKNKLKNTQNWFSYYHQNQHACEDIPGSKTAKTSRN